LDAYSRIREKVDIVGVCDRKLDLVHALIEKYGLSNCTAYDDCDKAIAECDCDLVDVCLPNFLHHDVTIKALKRGRNVICEKPLATTVEDAQDMVDTSRRR